MAVAGADLKCGSERQLVKVAADANAGTVNILPQRDTTIEALGALPAPDPPIAGGEARGRWSSMAAEFETFRIEGSIFAARKEDDGDIHLALSDGRDHHLIAEVVDPRCAEGSIALDPIRAVRLQLRAYLEVFTRQRLEERLVGKHVLVTGIGFFDKLHGQKGAAPNGIELHPVIRLEALP
jgi:hypothetical protein